MTCRLLVLLIVASLGTAAQAQRPASAPVLVPVRLDIEGSFRIAPPYVADPAFIEKPSVPKGRVIRFTMNSAESRIFPTGPVGRGARPGGSGQPGQAPAEPPQHQTFERQVAVYVPAGYVANTPAPFIIVQDGASPKYRNTIPVVLDNLIHEKRVPAIIAIMVHHGGGDGPGSERALAGEDGFGGFHPGVEGAVGAGAVDVVEVRHASDDASRLLRRLVVPAFPAHRRVDLRELQDQVVRACVG